MNKTKNFIKSSMVYFIGNVSIKALNFLCLPIFTAVLTPDDYGYFDFVIATIGILIPLVFFDISATLLRFMYDYKEIQQKYKVVGNVFILTILFTAIYTIIYIIVGLTVEIKYLSWIYVYGLSSIIQGIYLSIARGVGRNTCYVYSGIIGSVISLGTNCVLVLVLKLGVLSLFISGILSNIAQIIFIEMNIMVLKNIRKTELDYILIRNLLKFSFPLMLNACSFWILTNANRIIVASTLGVSFNGYIAIADKFAVLIVIFSSIFSLAWQETAYSLHSDKLRATYYEEMLNNYINVLCVAVCLLVPITYYIFPFMINYQFNDAKWILPPYYLVTILSAIASFFTNLFNAEKNNTFLFIANLISGIINIVLLYIMLPKYGINAFVWSLFISYFINIIIRYSIFRRKIIKLTIDYKFLILFGIIFIAEYLVYSYGDLNSNIFIFIISLITSSFVLKPLIKKIFHAFF